MEEIKKDEQRIEIIPLDSQSFSPNNEEDLKILINKQLSDNQLNYACELDKGFNRNKEIVCPPYDPYKLSCLMETNSRVDRSVRLRARNTVGKGWKIDYKEEVKKDPTLKNKADKEKKIIEPLFKKPNLKMSFRELMEMVKIDEEITGNGYLEVVRNPDGVIVTLNHVPSNTIRITKDNLFVQYCGGAKKLYFKEFGNIDPISKRNGKAMNNLPYNELATEIIHFKIHSPRSYYYGIPRLVSALPAIYGNKLTERKNINFFENDSTPRLVIVVQNGRLDEECISNIRSFLNRDGKGVQNTSRSVILQGEKGQTRFDGSSQNTKIDVIKVGDMDEASFQEYRNINNEEIREVFGVASAFFTSEGSNRSNANELIRLTIDQEFIPDLEIHEERINNTIVSDFGIQYIELKFNKPEALTQDETSIIHTRYSTMGAITINEIREAIGKEKFPDEYIWANYSMPMVLALINKGELTIDNNIKEEIVQSLHKMNFDTFPKKESI